MVNSMNETRSEFSLARWILSSALVVVSVVFGEVDAGTDSYDNLLLSGRMETIYFHNLTDRIREGLKENSRFYFNNIFVNLEGDLGSKSDFIVEFRPLTSDLYLLGGFLTIAEALEGVGDDDTNPRKTRIDNLITKKIRELDVESEKSGFERAQVGFFFSDQFGLQLGRVRNPFGFWDDYSIFRNLSALKTDPISLGVALRRADLGLIAHGHLFDHGLSYEAAVLQGSNTLSNRDDNNRKDIVLKLGTSLDRVDFGANYYAHDFPDPNHAFGLYYRYRTTYRLTLLGELIYINNDVIDVATKGFYVQGNYDLSERLMEGLRWNIFFETYDSELLEIDLEKDLDYRFAGTYFQVSTGFRYAYNRNIDLGAKVISGADEEGDRFYKAAFKIDAKF